jgi:hypothetical protein
VGCTREKLIDCSCLWREVEYLWCQVGTMQPFFCLVGKSRGTFCVFLEKCCKESKHLSFWVSLVGGGPSYLAHGGGIVCMVRIVLAFCNFVVEVFSTSYILISSYG